MSVVSTITATNISTTGTTINYTLGSFASNIYLYRFQATVAPSPLTVAGTLVQTVVPGTSNGNFIDTSLLSNTAYTYAFYNGNVTGTATPYNPYVYLKTYVNVTELTTSNITETSTQINYTLSNQLSSLTTCYLYRYSSTTSILTAPTTLNTSTGTLITSIDVDLGSNITPTVITSNYTDSTLTSNTSYTYAFYNGQTNATSKILSDASIIIKSAVSTTFTTINTSSMTATNKSNNTLLINYTLTNAISVNTNTYLFRFIGSTAPIADPTTGVQVSSEIVTTNGGTSSTPINATGLSANIQYTFAFYNGTTSSATILRNASTTRNVQSITSYTTNVLNTALTATFVTPVSASINYTLSNTPSNIGTTVYLYRFPGTNSAPTTLTGGTSITSVALTANNSSLSSTFSNTGLTVNTTYTYAFYSGNVAGTSIILTNNGSTAISVSIDTTVTTVAFTSITNILNMSGKINYTLTNSSSTTIPSYLYRFVGSTAPSLLSGAGVFIDSANSIGTVSFTNDTNLTGATQYTYAFYNGQTVGTNEILTNISGAPQTISFKTTNVFNSSITAPIILNTQASINYTLTNTGVNSSTATVYLYRFNGNTAPTSDPTVNGTSITTISVTLNTTNTNTFINTELSVATQYTYAFYNGDTSSATILTDTSPINKSVTLTTTNIILNTLTSSNVTNNSAQLNYNISNSTTTQGTTVYLYRFTSIPSTILSISGNGGTNVNAVMVDGSTIIDSSYNNIELLSDIFYYAFYFGNTTGTSQIIPISTGGNYITVKDFVDVSSLTATNITTTSVDVNYILNNSLSVDVTSYLYRFTNTTSPSLNPTLGTNVTSILTNTESSSNSFYSDLSLNINTVYTYAFYTGTNESSAILTDLSGNPRRVTIITSEYITTINASNVSITSTNINYSITNPLIEPITAYLYRFVKNTTPSYISPSINPTIYGTQITSVNINANSSLNSQTYLNTGLTQNTGYVYAFYTSADSNGVILKNSSGTVQSVSIFTDMYVRTLSVVSNSNTYLTLNYRLGNVTSVNANTSYIYRFNGSTAPSLLDTSTGTLIVASSNTSINTYYNTGLIINTQYTYAFYDGSSNGVSQKMYIGDTNGPNYPLTTITTTAYTSNQAISIFTSPSVFNNSSILNYTITNNSANLTANVYLYRFTGSTPPAILSGGTFIVSNSIGASQTFTDTSYSNPGLNASTIYYYAFYNGNINSTSSILPILENGNYITVQTTGVSQSIMTATSITSNSADINYNITNASNSSTAILYLYRYTGIITATTPLNTNTGTLITSIVPSIPITLSATGNVNSSITVSDLSENKIYTFQFYNNNINGSSPILTDVLTTGGTNRFVTFKTAVSDNSLTNSNVLNKSATISYTLSNTNDSVKTSYLYRFVGSSAPSTLNTSTGTYIIAIDTSSGTNLIPTINTNFYNNTALTPNTQYTYAFYNGQINNNSTILTNTSGTIVSTSFTTPILLNTILTTNTLTNTSVTIEYTLTNNSNTRTAYLYRFTGSSAPTTLNTATGTNIINGVSVSNTPITNTVTNSSLTRNTIYTYAFYNGNLNSSSTMLTTDSSNTIQLSIYTSTDVIISTLNPTELTSNQVNINYTLFNYQNTNKTSYLYRFIGPSAPTTLNTSTGTNVTSVITSAANTQAIPGTVDSFFNDTNLDLNLKYTYGFYNGTTNNSSILLQNYSNTSLTTTIYTTNESIISYLTSSTLTNTFNTINYSATNNQPESKSLYLYRFSSTTVPNILDLTDNGTLITNFTILSGASAIDSILDTSLDLNTNYTYAFFNGNSVGTSIVLTNYDGTPQVLNIATTNVFNTSLTATNISTTSATINYIIPNTPSSSGIIIYLYRFDGLTAPEILTTIGSYDSAIQLKFFAVPGNTTTNSSHIDNSITSNSNYTYAFYNGNIDGTSLILQDNSTSLNPVSVTINSYYGIISLLSISNTTNTSTNINYIITTDLTTPNDVYLYRFDNNISVPSILDTSLTGATNLNTITLPSNDIINSSFFDSTLSYNSQYTYAIYNGTSNGSSIILTDSSNVGQSVFATTSNIYLPSLSFSSISTSSISLDYTLNNFLSNTDSTVYLYRFNGSSAPSILTNGTSISDGVFVLSDTSSSSTIIDSTVSVNNTYTYAFYSGNTQDSSVILTDNSSNLMNVYISVNVYYGIIIDLSSSNIAYNSANIDYSIQNTLTEPTNAYLYRFNGNITAPSTLNTGLADATNVTNTSISANSVNSSTYTDLSLNPVTTYTYAFYSGTVNGFSIILKNISNTPVQTIVLTLEEPPRFPPVTYDIITTTFKNIGFEIILLGTDPQESILTYTYDTPTNGTISGTGPNIIYTPTNGFVGTDSFTYYATNIYNLSSTSSTVNLTIKNDSPCFKEGSRILCFNPQEGKEEYIPIETIRKGTLVKTIKHGYVKVDMIGKSTIYNSGDSERITNRLFICAPDQYPELFEELVLTGYHAILVDRFKNTEERARTRELLKYNYMTDDKYRLPACIDERATPYEIEGEFTIWHVALENEDYFMNYGIYANGLVVESCSKRYLKELSKMTLIE